jgi:hypothetical protein
MKKIVKKITGCSKCAERRAKMRKIMENHIARKNREKADSQAGQVSRAAADSGGSDHRVDGNFAVHAARAGHRWGRGGKRF